MNYLRGALSAASQYYKELPPINPSTLTGAIDVIVVQRPAEEEGNEGQMELACTPFHVRFGKWQVLRPGDKKVTVNILYSQCMSLRVVCMIRLKSWSMAKLYHST